MSASDTDGRVGRRTMRVAARDTHRRGTLADGISRSERALLRRVRWQLVAVSAASMLLVLILLGAALYLAVAGALAAAGTAQLDARAAAMGEFIEHAPPPGSSAIIPRDVVPADEPGVALGGPASGTIAIVVAADVGAAEDQQLEQSVPAVAALAGLPDTAAIETAAQTGQRDLRTGGTAGTPLRILTVPIDRDGQRFVLQVAQDLTAERQALTVLVAVLAAGGLLALATSVVVGFVYAGRALVPIRESLKRQREFAAEASHELRTPLTVIRASLEDLRRNRGRPVSEVGATLEDMEAETEHLSELVDDLLFVARSDSGALEVAREPLDLADVAVDAVAGLTRLASDHGVQLELDPAPTPIEGDRDRLRQLVRILVDNAVRHSPAGGRVVVTVRGAREASLVVDDEGPGVRPEDRERIFERFWRAPDAPAGGSGLGLAIARWIAQAHGGRIAVTARQHRGARFAVTFPMRSEPARGGGAEAA